MEGSARDGSAERVSPARAYGSEPQVRGLGWGWPCAIIAAVLYGSCVPFDFKPDLFAAADGFGTPAIGLHLPLTDRFEDIITNLLVYVPIGLTLVLCGRRGRSSRLGHLVVAVLLGTGVSVLAETLQTSIVSRVASWLDVFLNSVGTAVGAVLGVTLHGAGVSALRRLRAHFADRPFATLASLLVFGLFFYRLAPFDFITDTEGLRDSFLRAGWIVPDRWAAAPSLPSYADVVGQLVPAAWFAGLGYVLALGGRESGRRPIPTMALAIQQGCNVVVITELMQLFTRSHVFDIATIVIGSLAVFFGAGFAVLAVDARTRAMWKDQSGDRKAAFAAAAPTPVLLMLVVFQVGALLGSSIDPRVLSLGGIDFSRIEWTPFEVLWRQPMPEVAADILSTLVIYGVLATTLVLVLRRAHIAQARIITGVAVTTLAVVVEVLHSATVTHAADITEPMLALLASANPSLALRALIGIAPSHAPA